MVFIGMTKWSTLTLTTTQTESFLLITLSKAIGTDQESPTETILGNTPRIKMLPLTNPFTWSWISPSEEPTDTSKTESLLSLGRIPQPEPLPNSTITKDNGGLLGEITVSSRSIASGYGIWLLKTQNKQNPSPSRNQLSWAPRNDPSQKNYTL